MSNHGSDWLITFLLSIYITNQQIVKLDVKIFVCSIVDFFFQGVVMLLTLIYLYWPYVYEYDIWLWIAYIELPTIHNQHIRFIFIIYIKYYIRFFFEEKKKLYKMIQCAII